MLLPLNNRNLTQFPDGVSVPLYDRTKLKTGIVHVGVGGFHRSHQAVYTNNYIAQTGDFQWGICGVGLREADRKMKTILAEQEYLYTVMVKNPTGSAEYQVVGCMTNFILGCDDPRAVINVMANQDTKIVSLTITEGGYNYNPATGEFDFTHPDVIHDLANPETPRLVFGYIAAALKLRYQRGQTPFTIQSCDNIQHNGNLVRKVMLTYISRLNSDLAQWVANEVAFPNAMVDRITPVTTQADIEGLESAGVADKWPVTCEPFSQWVVEDTFSSGRPAWECVGVQFVSDVTPYEIMKIRLLNAGHSVLGILGSIYGYKTIDESVTDQVFAEFLKLFMDQEVTRVLPPVDGMDLNAYKATLIQRFSNPHIKDNLTRICSDNSSKIATFIIPTVFAGLEARNAIACSALVIAAWCYYSDKRQSHQGERLEVNDDLSDQLHHHAQLTRDDEFAFLKQPSIFGNLHTFNRFVQPYVDFTRRLYQGANIKLLMTEVINFQSSKTQ